MKKTDYDVNYVKEQVKKDVEYNLANGGLNYSAPLGQVLLAFLEVRKMPTDFVAIASSKIIGDLEKIAKLSGIMVDRHEPVVGFYNTLTCGLAIHFLHEQGNEKLIEEIRLYAKDLLEGKIKIGRRKDDI